MSGGKEKFAGNKSRHRDPKNESQYFDLLDEIDGDALLSADEELFSVLCLPLLGLFPCGVAVLIVVFLPSSLLLLSLFCNFSAADVLPIFTLFFSFELT